MEGFGISSALDRKTATKFSNSVDEKFIRKRLKSFVAISVVFCKPFDK
jgi:hypothetical protein